MNGSGRRALQTPGVARFGEWGPRGRNSAEKGQRRFVFRKNTTRAIVFSSAFNWPHRPCDPRRALRAPPWTRSPLACAPLGRRPGSAAVTRGERGHFRGQSVWNDSFGLDLLQPVEIPQNRQSILWKSLEKTSGNLEKLGEKLGGSGRSYFRPIVDLRAPLSPFDRELHPHAAPGSPRAGESAHRANAARRESGAARFGDGERRARPWSQLG